MPKRNGRDATTIAPIFASGATSMPPMQSSNTSIVVGSSAVIFASGQSSFGRCVTNVGWMRFGSIFLEKISLVISNSSHDGLIDRPSASAREIFSAFGRSNQPASPVASLIASLSKHSATARLASPIFEASFDDRNEISRRYVPPLPKR